MNITLQGNPKSTQSIYRAACIGNHPRSYMTHEGKALKEQYQWEVKKQWKYGTLITPINLQIYFYFKDKRPRDLDNQNKLILDSMTGIVYRDDKQIDELHLYRNYDKENPRIEITITSLIP